MDSHLPPTAFYVILALAVTVTARVNDKDVLNGALLRRRPWLVGLLHVPVLMAWVHVGYFLVAQLAVTKMPWYSPGYIHLVIHMVVVGFVGMVCVCIYLSQIRQERLDSAEVKARSQ